MEFFFANFLKFPLEVVKWWNEEETGGNLGVQVEVTYLAGVGRGSSSSFS